MRNVKRTQSQGLQLLRLCVLHTIHMFLEAFFQNLQCILLIFTLYGPSISAPFPALDRDKDLLI